MKYNISINPATTTKNKTGSWRSSRPIFDAEKCTTCGTCERFCPEGVVFLSDKINSKGKNYRQTNLDFCKGCGICATECPVKAIEMRPEIK